MGNYKPTFFKSIWLVVLILLAITPNAYAEKRVALVVGNSNYTSAPILTNPKNDANAIAASLTKLGFDVIKGLDLDERQTLQILNEFRKKIITADVALLFYAGHGLQVANTNYLVPIDASLESELDLQAQATRLSAILNMMEHPNRTSIVLLDACRDNPLARRLARSLGTRSNNVGRGLARVETGVGTYIGFSTEPGNVALDGEGEHSPFAQALLNNISRANLDIESIMRLVRAEVYENTRGDQTPWGNSSLIGAGFIFNKITPKPIIKPAIVAKPKSSAIAPKPNRNAEVAYWNSIQDAKSKGYFQSYITQFPDGLFLPLAKMRMAEIDAAKETKPKIKIAPKKEVFSNPVLQKQPNQQLTLLKTTNPTIRDENPNERIQARELIKELQSKLYALNFDPGTPDGLLGGKTRKAIGEFQQSVNRSISGKATVGLLNLLRKTKAPSSWGGLGFLPSSKRVFGEMKLPNRRAVELAIASSCRNCREVLIFSASECGALSMSPKGWGWAVRANKQATITAANKSCSRFGGNCQLQKVLCANGS